MFLGNRSLSIQELKFLDMHGAIISLFSFIILVPISVFFLASFFDIQIINNFPNFVKIDFSETINGIV